MEDKTASIRESDKTIMAQLGEHGRSHTSTITRQCRMDWIICPGKSLYHAIHHSTIRNSLPKESNSKPLQNEIFCSRLILCIPLPLFHHPHQAPFKPLFRNGIDIKAGGAKAFPLYSIRLVDLDGIYRLIGTAKRFSGPSARIRRNS